MALLVAACGGGGSSSTGAGGGSPATSGGGSGATGADAVHQQQLAYSQCMRSHGVPDYPDPPAPGGPAMQLPASIDTSSPQYQQAADACQHLMPGGQVSKAEQQQMMNQLLKFTQCVRAHGEPDFPDPTLVNGVPNFNPADTTLNLSKPSPQLQAAENACSKYNTSPKPAGGGS
jgi:hypothetical protein